MLSVIPSPSLRTGEPQTSNRRDRVINLKTAKALGLTATNCDSTRRGEMNTYHRFVRLVLLVLITLASLLMVAHSAEKPAPPKGAPTNSQAALRERGRYLVILGGCNDCHTAGFAQSGGTTPESEWLTGDTVGWRGPWGTTYPPNLRLLMQTLSEDGWVQFAHSVSGRPPMPFWTLHIMTAQDLRAMYQFIKSLGPKGVAAPPGLPPDQQPKTPYILFVPQAPK